MDAVSHSSPTYRGRGILRDLDEIDERLSNRYSVIDGDDTTLCIKDRKTGEHYEITVKDIGD